MSGQVSFTDRYLHILRNPYGWSEDQVRDARLWAADNIERLETRIDALRGLLREAQYLLSIPDTQLPMMELNQWAQRTNAALAPAKAQP
jgi:hypothetical protein